MPALRRCQATFCEVLPRTDGENEGLLLRFRPERSRLGVEFVEDYAPLGPEHCIPSVGGLGKILRILRAARVAAPDDPSDLIGEIDRAQGLLEKALGTRVRLHVRGRSRQRFVAWTENGVEVVEGVSEVREQPDAFLVFQRGSRLPQRFDRDSLLRQRTECERWFQVVEIERL